MRRGMAAFRTIRGGGIKETCLMGYNTNGVSRDKVSVAIGAWRRPASAATLVGGPAGRCETKL